jgi:LysM domain-containing protein
MPGQLTPPQGVSPGYVRMTCDRPSLDIYCLLGPESPAITNIDGGWEIVQRPKQNGMTIWRGVEPLQGTFTILLDGFATDVRRPNRFLEPMTPLVQELLDVCRGNNNSQPGLLHIWGIPEFPIIDWVIETMDISTDQSDVIRSDTNFKVARQKISIVVREYSPPRYVKAKTPTGSSTDAPATYKVKKNDTPHTIAMRRGCKWTDIRMLNLTIVKKANQKLKVGTQLRVPVAEKRNTAKGAR